MAKLKEEKVGIDAILKELEGKYGLTKLEKGDTVVIDSGSYTINRATGLGGYPLGKLIELFGQESCGKSTIVLHAIASFQKNLPEKKVALFDYEYSFDLGYAKSVGVDVDKLLIYQPNTQEQGYDMIIGLLEKEVCSLIVIDSHTSAIPTKILEGEMGDATIGIAARNNSKFLGKIKGLLEKSQTLCLAVSQTRTNIGGMGDVNVPTGGNSWKFYSDLRFKIWKSNDKVNELNKTTLDVIKNKCAIPFGKAEFDIVWGKGIDNAGEIIDMGCESGVIKKAGSWFSYEGTKIGQGKDSVRELFAKNPELFEEIKQKVLLQLNTPKEEIVVEEKV